MKALKITAVVFGVLFCLAILSAMIGASDEQPGSPTVYTEIETSADCNWLQESFDRAAGNNDRATPGTAQFDWTLGYMKAADDRMSEVGCYR